MPKKSLNTAAQDVSPELQEAQSPQTDSEIAEMPANMPGIRTGESEIPPAPQTDNESDEFTADGLSLQENILENTPDSQTGTGIKANTAEADGNAAGTADDGDSLHTGTQTPDILPEPAVHDALQPDTPLPPQTGTESSSDAERNLSDVDDNPVASQTDFNSHADEGTSGSPGGITASEEGSDDAPSQTDTETSDILPGSAAQGPETPDTPPDSQTDTAAIPAGSASPDDKIKKPRRRAAKTQSGESVEAAAQTGTNPAPARRRRARTEPVLAIDNERSVETREDKLKSDLLDLIESQKGKRILAGTIQGVERSADNPNITFAVIYHGAFKVIIPADETVRPPEDFRDRSPADVMHYLVTKRLGAEIDYIVKGVDVKSGIAAASRLEAMTLKRREYYFGTDRDGNNLIYEGLSAEARVVSVIRAGMFVDLFGLETYIPLRELSYQRWIDAMAHFQPGQRVLVKILALDRSDRSNIRVSASVKQAGDNPYEQALRRYTPGSRYVGTVSMVDVSGVFVSLDGGVDCLCTHPKRGRPPRGARVTVRVIGVNHETNRIWGAITHMTTAR